MGWLFSAAGLVGVPVKAAVLDPELPGLGVVHRRRPVCHLHQESRLVGGQGHARRVSFA
jgi:hypothetical protein